MNKFSAKRRRNLEYILITRDAQATVKWSNRTVRIGSYVIGAVLMLGPAAYFPELGYPRFIISFCAAVGGIVVFFGEANRSLTEQVKDLHEYLDFEQIKADIERTDS